MVTKAMLRERARARLESRKVEGERGSLILDILIGMAIFALIAIIAVSAISQYRERAYEQTVVSDVLAVSLILEANYTDTQSYPATMTAAGQVFADSGGKLSKGIRAKGYLAVGGNVAFCLEHVSGGTYNPTTGAITGGTVDAYAVYNTTRGGMYDSGHGAVACPTS